MVAMSGGVDSSVAAALLIEQGYDIVGAFMRNWSGCDWEAERRDALRVAAHLGIELIVYDFEEEYRARVYDHMVREYAAGRTPNPDVLCNGRIKFDLLWREAVAQGCDALATGHYARTEPAEHGVALKRGIDANKDQSYFLCRLGQKELVYARFPVGEMTKPQVRALARARQLPVADKKDSQGLCFVGRVDLPHFLQEAIACVPGNIVTADGVVLGRHDGVELYTIGQRKRLGVSDARPYYVVERRLSTHELVVGHDDDPALYTNQLTMTDVHWVSGAAPTLPWRGTAKIRYRQDDQVCELAADAVHVQFEHRQRAVAPGQFIVFYDGDTLVGSGVIDTTA